MKSPLECSDIFALYSRYGWKLRRLLISEPTVPAGIPDDVEQIDSDIDAAWFTRPTREMVAAWELRYLGNPPVAFVEHLDETSPGFEIRLQQVEDRLRERLRTSSEQA